MKRIYLIDVSSLFFRAFYAIRPLTSPSGMPTNAIYGFLTMITKLMKDEKPDYMVFCYDQKEPSFRVEIYEDYKANRDETPEDLIPQIPYIKKLAEHLGIPSVEVKGYEADDLIGTLTKFSRKNNLEVFIVSGDKDFGQLIEPHVWLYDTMKNTKIDTAGVKEKWGIRPDQVVDYLALVGDSSDNVPGVKGIGPKGAQKLLEEYDTLEKIYQNIEHIKGSIKDKLIHDKEMAFLSRKLVQIVTDVKVSESMEDYHLRSIHFSDLQKLMAELGFKNLEKTIASLPHASGNGFVDSNTQNTSDQVTSNITQSAQKLSDLQPVVDRKADGSVERVEAQTKTDIVDHFREIELTLQEISVLKSHQNLWILKSTQGFSLGSEENSTIYHIQASREELSDVLNQLSCAWSGFDLKQIWHDLNLKKPLCHWDNLLAAYVLKAGDKMDFDYIYTRYTGQVAAGELVTSQVTFSEQLNLRNNLLKKVQEIDALKILKGIDFPLSEILYQMEVYGVKIDLQNLAEQSKGLGHDLMAIEKDVFKICGETFNIASPKQLGHILFDKLKLPVMKKTKTGFSTDNEVLEKLKDEHPVPDLVLRYRELAKLKSTYTDALQTIVKEDGRIHTTFNQALTATGRLSSTEPNLQNIPIRTQRGAQVRKAFIAEKNKKLLSADYSQIELRVLAHYSEDKNLCQAFHDNLDIHQATAAEVFGVSLEEVTPDMRRAAKAVNFGIAYGQGAFGLAEGLGISRTEAADIIKKYFTQFPGVQRYIDQTIQSAIEKGYVETLHGRRRYMDELRSQNQAMRKFGERAAINAPMQGTASDIVKIAMIELYKKIPIPMILQVHDELVFEDTETSLLKWKAEIAQIMENAVQLRVPLKVNIHIGNNWDESH